MAAPVGDGPAGLTLLDGVRWDGVPLPGSRTHDLLAVLALAAPRAVSDSRLLEEVWAERETPSTGKALQVLVSRTRAATDPGLVVRVGQGYRLGDLPVDVRTAARARGRGRPRPRGRRRGPRP